MGHLFNSSTAISWLFIVAKLVLLGGWVAGFE
jgi:hypothetical protein